MLSKFTSGMDSDEKKEMEGAYTSSFLFRKRMSELIENDTKILVEKLAKDDLTSSPSWDREVLSILAEMKVNKKMLSYLK
jgi:hypothetical protein